MGNLHGIELLAHLVQLFLDAFSTQIAELDPAFVAVENLSELAQFGLGHGTRAIGNLDSIFRRVFQVQELALGLGNTAFEFLEILTTVSLDGASDDFAHLDILILVAADGKDDDSRYANNAHDSDDFPHDRPPLPSESSNASSQEEEPCYR